MDVHEFRKYLLAEVIEQETGLAVQVAAADGVDEISEQAARDIRGDDDRRLAR